MWKKSGFLWMILLMVAFVFMTGGGGCGSDGGNNGGDPARPYVKVPLSAQYAYVGGVTTKTESRDGNAKGLEVFRIDADGTWENIQTVPAFNPFWLVVNKAKTVLYSAQADTTEVCAYAIDQETGKLTLLNKMETSGLNGVSIAVSPDDKFVVVANYMGGTVDSFSLNPDGSFKTRVTTIDLSGEANIGITREQFAGIPHQVIFSENGDYLFVPDKGRDIVHSFIVNHNTGELTPNNPSATSILRTGSGPRHMALHPTLPYAYIVNEIDLTVTVAAYDAKNGVLEGIQWLPTVPDSYFYVHKGSAMEADSGTEIAVSEDGRFVYASNRGANNVAIYAVDQHTGRLSSIGFEEAGGRHPRSFAIDPSGNYLISVNEPSESLSVLAIDRTTGLLECLGDVVHTGTPLCLAFR